MHFKEGDKVVVTGNKSGHLYPIGSVVTLYQQKDWFGTPIWVSKDHWEFDYGYNILECDLELFMVPEPGVNCVF